MRGERGSVMLEYIALNMGIIFILALAGHFFLDPGESGSPAYKVDVETGEITTNGIVQQYGNLGAAFKARYELCLRVISMPYP